jgi:regulator of protease activity HflC (stomatin/prohibitin superfamily)
MDVVELVTTLAGAGALWLVAGFRVVRQYERGVVFRFGRVRDNITGPGLTRIQPGVDKMRKVNMQIVTMPVPAQDGITRDNVTVRVDAVVYFRVVDPVRAVVEVQDYVAAVAQVAQTSLRSIIGKSELDDLLSNRERLNQGLELLIDSPALGWGVQIDRVEIKDVALPESMKRSMSRQAEAERERRARVISADGELQASAKLALAAAAMSEHPAAMQLRLLETVVQVASEKNSTLVLPFPVELLRFVERMTPSAPPAAAPTAPAAPIPQVTAPQVAAPEVTAPQVAAPQLTAPQVTAPQVTAPQVTAPQVAPPAGAPSGTNGTEPPAVEGAAAVSAQRPVEPN